MFNNNKNVIAAEHKENFYWNNYVQSKLQITSEKLCLRTLLHLLHITNLAQNLFSEKDNLINLVG